VYLEEGGLDTYKQGRAKKESTRSYVKYQYGLVKYQYERESNINGARVKILTYSTSEEVLQYDHNVPKKSCPNNEHLDVS